MLQRFVAASSAARAAPFSSAARKASGTPLSALDPPGYPTVEATYAKIASNLCVRASVLAWHGAAREARRVSPSAARAPSPSSFSRRPFPSVLPPARHCRAARLAPARRTIVRKTLKNKPLTLAEKIIYGHLDDPSLAPVR